MSGRALLVRGGLVVDGTGAEPRAADVLVEGERIAAVLAPSGHHLEGVEVHDVSGLVVAPGFIDTHSHSDGSPLLAEDDTSKILQGVTTEVVGNCGLSLAPLAATEEPANALTDAMLGGRRPSWRSVAELFEVLDAAGHVTNVCQLVGHGALRGTVLGGAARAASTTELATMVRLLEEGLAAGAFGLSSGLVYPPGMFAATGELAALCASLGTRVYATHLRNESDGLAGAVAEAVRTVAGAGCRLHVSHLKVTGRQNWGAVDRALDLLDDARRSGLSVTQDAYPYTAASTALSACLPPWAHAGGDDALLARLDDPAELARLRQDVEAPATGGWDHVVAGAGWDGIVVTGTTSGELDGLSLARIADRTGVSGFDALVHLLRTERLRVAMVEFSMHDDDVDRVLRHPSTMIGSDGLPIGVGNAPHPRLHGTFPRVLGEYVRERGALTLADAVHRMTGLAAETFGVPERGRVAPGLIADLVALDPAAVTDRATYACPTREPAGISWVMQAGSLVVRDGRWLGRRRGRRLRPD